MLSNLFILSLVLDAAAAWPYLAEQAAAKRQAAPAVVPFPMYPGAPSHALFNVFDPVEQLVSTSGDHAWQAPGPGDIRGPCAGLNAAANHNYLPRNGIATYAAVETGLLAAFGLDQTATQLLHQTTTFFDGDPLTEEWSIGFASSKVDVPGIGALQQSILGEPTGICAYGHLKSEGDASVSRGDFLAPTMNSNCASYPQFYNELIKLAVKRNGPAGLITPPVLAEHQNNRKLYSIANNPNYFSPAFAGVAFTPAAHLFVFEMMANHSATHPRGFLTPSVLDSFFSYTKHGDGSRIYKYGYERIPNNWYRRSLLDTWTLSDIVMGVSSQCAAYPQTCAVGGNTNGVNSFSGVNLGDISGGLINSEAMLTDPSALGCFISQNIQAEAPSSLERAFDGAYLAAALALIPTMLLPALAPLGPCQNLPPGKTITQYGNIFPGGKLQQTGPRASSNGL